MVSHQKESLVSLVFFAHLKQHSLKCQEALCVGHLLVKLRESVARHSLSFLGPQQPVEILDHVLAAELGSLPVRDQNAPALDHLHKTQIQQ